MPLRFDKLGGETSLPYKALASASPNVFLFLPRTISSLFISITRNFFISLTSMISRAFFQGQNLIQSLKKVSLRYYPISGIEALFFLGFQPLKPGNRWSGDLMLDDTSRADKWMEILRPYLRRFRREKITFVPEKSALLIIDMQRFFLDPQSHAYLSDASPILENVRKLLHVYRASSLPVIFTRHALLRNQDPGAMGRWWCDIIYEDDAMSSIVEELKPLPDEIVIRKARYSAFTNTDLDQILKNLGVTQLVITGVMTHLCCETTARDAFVRDFDVFFVIDGTATRNEDLHLSSLKTLCDGFAILVKSEEVIAWLKQRK